MADASLTPISLILIAALLGIAALLALAGTARADEAPLIQCAYSQRTSALVWSSGEGCPRTIHEPANTTLAAQITGQQPRLARIEAMLCALRSTMPGTTWQAAAFEGCAP